MNAGPDKDQPAGQQDLVGPGHLKDPHLGRQQHHLLLGARSAENLSLKLAFFNQFSILRC